MLARIEKLDGVRAAWTDREGATIVVAFAAERSPADAVALVSAALAPRVVTELSGSEAAAAGAACRAGAPGWYRAPETIVLSQEEARVIAGRVARAAAERAGLAAAERDAFEAGGRAALLQVFAVQHRRAAFDARALNAEIKAALAQVAEGLALAPERRQRLRAELEAGWAGGSTPQSKTGSGE